MMIELQAAYLMLKRWNQNPAATRRQIGIWQHWKQETEAMIAHFPKLRWKE
jgi:hypothetical protein